MAPLPEPPAFTPGNVLRTVGPGVIGLGVAIGSGYGAFAAAALRRALGRA